MAAERSRRPFSTGGTGSRNLAKLAPGLSSFVSGNGCDRPRRWLRYEIRHVLWQSTRHGPAHIHLGSSAIVLDRETSELVEQTTYQAYGAPDFDYRPSRWDGFREDYEFTGKEDDVEVGLAYFGKRHLAPSLNRWASADPLTIHTSTGRPRPSTTAEAQRVC